MPDVLPAEEMAGEDAIQEVKETEPADLKEKATGKGAKVKKSSSFKWIQKLVPRGNKRSKEYDLQKAAENLQEKVKETKDPEVTKPECDKPVPVLTNITTYPAMPVAKNATHYNMNHLHRGKALILNFEEFDPERKLAFRDGSKKDKEDLTRCMEKLEFTVESHDNLGHREFWKVLDAVQKEDHQDRDCLVVAIMTHGDVDEIKLKDGSGWPNSMIWEHFSTRNCPTLAGKPKIFIFQACRGSGSDKGYELSAQKVKIKDETDFHPMSYIIPNYADVFVAFSCPLGQVSWRSSKDGSWLIQTICEIFERDAYKEGEDLDSLFTTVKREVALNNMSDHDDPALNNSVQVPVITSSFIRKLVFKPKGTSPTHNGSTHFVAAQISKAAQFQKSDVTAVVDAQIPVVAVAVNGESSVITNGEGVTAVNGNNNEKTNGAVTTDRNGEEPSLTNGHVPDVINGVVHTNGEVSPHSNNGIPELPVDKELPEDVNGDQSSIPNRDDVSPAEAPTPNGGSISVITEETFSAVHGETSFSEDKLPSFVTFTETPSPSSEDSPGPEALDEEEKGATFVVTNGHNLASPKHENTIQEESQ